MKRTYIYLMLLLGIILNSCKGSDTAPVDLSDILKEVELSMKGDKSEEWDHAEACTQRYDKSLPKGEVISVDEEQTFVMRDTTFFVEFPEHSDSKDPFLKEAQDAYNSVVLMFDILSNYDFFERMYYQGASCSEDVQEANLAMSPDIIKNKEVRQKFHEFVELVNKTVDEAPAINDDETADDDEEYVEVEEGDEESAEEVAEEEEDSSFDPYCESIYKPYFSLIDDSENVFVQLIEYRDEQSGRFTDKIKRYESAGEKERAKVMLQELNSCKTFEEQTLLFGLWADNPHSNHDDNWIIVVGERLMHAKKYSPFLFDVWLKWRALKQTNYFGSSRDSEIPNHYYNGYRKLCYQTIVHHYAQHLDDLHAKKQAVLLFGTNNVIRNGEYIFGNSAVLEMFQFMPHRFDSDDEDQDEEDSEPDSDEYEDESVEDE